MEFATDINTKYIKKQLELVIRHKIISQLPDWLLLWPDHSLSFVQKGPGRVVNSEDWEFVVG